MQAVRDVRAAKRRPRSAGASRFHQGALVQPPWMPTNMTSFEAQRPRKGESRNSGSVQQRIDMAQDAEALKARADHFEALAQKLKSENVALERRARELRGRVDELMRHDERDRLRLQVTTLRNTVGARDDKIIELRRRASATTLMEVAVARDEAMEEARRLKGLLLAERAARAVIDRGPVPNRTITGAAALLSAPNDAPSAAASSHVPHQAITKPSTSGGMRSGGGQEEDVALMVCELRDQIHWLRRQQLEQQQRASRREEELLAALAEAKSSNAHAASSSSSADSANNTSACQSADLPSSSDKSPIKLNTPADSNNSNGRAGVQPPSTTLVTSNAVNSGLKSSLKAKSKYGQLDSALLLEF